MMNLGAYPTSEVFAYPGSAVASSNTLPLALPSSPMFSPALPSSRVIATVDYNPVVSVSAVSPGASASNASPKQEAMLQSLSAPQFFMPQLGTQSRYASIGEAANAPLPRPNLEAPPVPRLGRGLGPSGQQFQQLQQPQLKLANFGGEASLGTTPSLAMPPGLLGSNGPLGGRVGAIGGEASPSLGSNVGMPGGLGGGGKASDPEMDGMLAPLLADEQRLLAVLASQESQLRENRERVRRLKEPSPMISNYQLALRDSVALQHKNSATELVARESESRLRAAEQALIQQESANRAEYSRLEGSKMRLDRSVEENLLLRREVAEVESRVVRARAEHQEKLERCHATLSDEHLRMQTEEERVVALEAHVMTLEGEVRWYRDRWAETQRELGMSNETAGVAVQSLAPERLLSGNAAARRRSDGAEASVMLPRHAVR